MSPDTLALLIPIVSVIGGVAIAIIAIISDHKRKQEMIKNGIEIPLRKPSPYAGLKFGFFLVGFAIGLLFGGILDTLDVFSEPEVGYFACIFLFSGLGLVLSSLYVQKKMDAKAQK